MCLFTVPVVCSSAVDRAATILDRAERALAGLAAEAATGRDYAEVARLARLAGAVRALRESGTATAADDAAAPVEPKSMATGPPPRAATAPEVKRRPYPKFLRDGDTLVKVGWSRRESAEYEHRSPVAALLRVSAAIERLAGAAGRFTTDDLMPALDAGRDPLPSYQSYLCLAFLREAGLAGRDGRSRYRAAPGLPEAARRAFNALPERG